MDTIFDTLLAQLDSEKLWHLMAYISDQIYSRISTDMDSSARRVELLVFQVRPLPPFEWLPQACSAASYALVTTGPGDASVRPRCRGFPRPTRSIEPAVLCPSMFPSPW